MLSRKLLIVLLVSFALLAVWGTLAAQAAWGDAGKRMDSAAAAGAAAVSAASSAAVEVQPASEVTRTTDSPAISTIDSPSPTCYLPAPGTGACYLAWSSIYVAASSGQYIITMTVSIEDELRAYHSGFFQNYMYIPGDMLAPGFRVTCGMPGDGGIPTLGNSYSYTIRARETGGLGAANYGSVYCPADVVRVYLPLARRP